MEVGGSRRSPVCIQESALSNVFRANRNLTRATERVPDRGWVVVVKWVSVISFVALSACGGRSARDISPSTGGTSGSGGGSAAGSAGTTGAVVTNSTGVDGLGCRGVPITDAQLDQAASTACAGTGLECGLLPSDLHLVVERSSRMNETIDGVSKWELIQRALQQLLPASSFTGFSLRVFGADGVGDAAACDPATYAIPIVPRGDGPAALESILGTLGALEPEGLAPTVPALAGALEEVERTQPSTLVGQRVVLILGGAPTECAGTPESLRATFEGSAVTSYVIALDPDFDVGPVGEATETWPFVISAGDPETRLTDALRHIAQGASRQLCSFGHPLPNAPQLTFDPARTRAFYGGEEIPHLASAEDCATSPNGGFYLQGDEYRSCACTCAGYTSCDGATWMFYCD